MPDPLLSILDDVQGQRQSAPRPMSPGLLTPGNIDLYAQPKVPNPDGGTSTVYSFSTNIDGREVLLPMVTPDGRLLNEEDAIREYQKTGKHLGMFDTPENATRYAEQLHNDYEAGKYERTGQRADPDLLAMLDEVQGATSDRRSLFARAYDRVFTAPEFITRGAAKLADWIDPNDPVERHPLESQVRGFAAGAVEGVASLLTPGDVALTATGFGPAARALQGIRGGAQAARGIQTAANVATAARGVERLADAESLPEAATGIAQTALGVAGVKTQRPPVPTREVPRPPVAELPAGTRFVGAPDGTIATVGETIPMTAAPDGSFVRGAPAASYVDDAGRQVFSGDPAAQTATRPVRGLLPPGPRFVADARGRVAGASHGDELLTLLDDVQSVADSSGGRSVPAAVLEREFETGVPARQATRVRQYSSDPEAVDVPLLNDSETSRQVGVAEPAADDFDEFARLFDDVAPDPRGEPGEAGFITTQLSSHLAGGVAGAATGAATGEDAEERLKRGLLFGVAGAAAPALLRRGGAPLPRGGVTRPPAPVLPMPERGRVPRVSQQGAPMRDPLAGVDVLLGKFSNPIVRSGIEERLIANNGYAQQRRGTIPASDIGRLSAGIRVDVSKALPKGTAVSGEVVTAYAKAVRQTQERVSELTAKLNQGAATDADLLRLEAARADADIVLKSLMGMRTEAGRALAAFRFLDGVLDSGRVDLIRGAADAVRDEAQRFARDFAAQPADPMARYRWLQEQGKPTLWDKTRSYYYANILSGLKTHERNVLGNVFNALGNTVAHPFAAGLDAVRAARTGQPREVLFTELPHGVAGAMAGMERGFADALSTLRHGVSPQALERGLKAAEAGKLDLPRVEFGGGGANPFNWPGRALDAVDVFFRSVAKNTELYETAYTQAWKEGKRGQALVDRMADLTSAQRSDGAALREAAEHVASRAVFQEKGGPITSWLSQGYRVPVLGQAMTFVIPFLRTPGNILRQGLETSPAGFAMAAARQGGRPGALAQGKAAMGSMAAGYLAWLAATGRLSGDGPRDAKARAELMERGWRPNSVRVGDTWVSYQLMQPLSVQAALVANAYESWAERDGKKDAADIAAQTIARSANSFLDQSFLSGLFDLAEALRDPERAAGQWAGRVGQSLSPLSGLQRTIQQGLDPVVRRPRGAAEQMQAGTPFLSEGIEPRLDRFGEPVVREGGPLRRALDPFNASTATSDPVAEELSRLGVDLPSLSERLTLPGGRILTREEGVALRQMQGRAAREALERVMGTRGYPRLPDAAKASLIERAINRARERTNAQVRREIARMYH